MKRILTLPLTIVILLSVQAGASGFKAVVPDTTYAGDILVGSPFTIDFYGVNDDVGMIGASLPFELYSPDAITAITHVNVGGISPYIFLTPDTWEDSSITTYNGWNKDGFWTFFADWSGWSWNGTLPDTVNFSGITMSEWSISDTTLYFKFHLQIDQEGTFCIDSIDHDINYFDWLFDLPVSFGGPYCWNIVKSSCICADFTSSTTAGEYPLPVQFTDLSGGYPVSWFWDFGDGIGTSTEQNPQYTYTGKGIFTVSLTISDGVSHNTIVKPDYVTVLGPTVCADFQATPTIGESPLEVQFIDLSTGDPKSWFWDFGDGIGTSAEQSPLYTYNTGGTYAVTLTVSDDFDSSIVVKPDYINVDPIAVSEIRRDLRPASFALGQNYPNPFNMQTKFLFALPERSSVNIFVYNVLGHKIKTLAVGEFEAGYWEVDWDGTSDYGVEVASGLYFYKIETEQFKDTKKLMLLK